MRRLRLFVIVLFVLLLIFAVAFYILTYTITLVAGGEEAKPHELPWVVYLEIDHRGEKTFCGGTLVNSDWVLTAAHCIPDKISPASIRGYLDSVDITKPEIQPIPFDKIIVREGFKIADSGNNSRIRSNDLALLRLDIKSEPMVEQIRQHFLTLSIQPLDPEKRNLHSKAGTQAIIVGWGETESRFKSKKLLKASVRIISNEECNRIYAGEISHDMICVEPINGLGAICNGDSGGPLTISDGQSAKLAGVASGRAGNCGRTNKPSVFTRVDTTDRWIHSTLISAAAESIY